MGKTKAFPGLLVNEIMNDSRKRKIAASLDVCFSNNAYSQAKRLSFYKPCAGGNIIVHEERGNLRIWREYFVHDSLAHKLYRKCKAADSGRS